MTYIPTNSRAHIAPMAHGAEGTAAFFVSGLQMRITRRTSVLAAFISLACGAVASAQAVTETSGLSLADTLTQLTAPLGSAPVGEALGLATVLEVATTPFGSSSGGFVFKLDPSTGLQVRTATTFGPSFAERALTSGEGKISVGASVISASYQRLGDLSLDRMQLGAVQSPLPTVGRVGTTNLEMSSTTVVVSGTVGVSEKLDVGAVVPMVRVRVDGVSTLVSNDGTVVLTAKGGAISSGLGDVGATVKYRFLTFGEGQPDPGGMALLAIVRIPTGQRESLRGLGVTRTLASLVFSSGVGRVRPHANGGFEFWSDGVDVATNADKDPPTVTARHQVQYAAGVEIEADPRLTLMIDVLGRHILGAGRIGFETATPTPPQSGVTALESAVALPAGINKLTLVPGLKVNVKGKLLLSLNALVSLWDNGLHARVTPVAGLDLSF